MLIFSYGTSIAASSPSSSKLGRFRQSFALCSLRTPPCQSANSLCIRNKLHCLLPFPCSIRRHFFVQRCQTSQSMELETFCFLNGICWILGCFELFSTAETGARLPFSLPFFLFIFCFSFRSRAYYRSEASTNLVLPFARCLPFGEVQCTAIVVCSISHQQAAALL